MKFYPEKLLPPLKIKMSYDSADYNNQRNHIRIMKDKISLWEVETIDTYVDREACWQRKLWKSDVAAKIDLD